MPDEMFRDGQCIEVLGTVKTVRELADGRGIPWAQVRCHGISLRLDVRQRPYGQAWRQITSGARLTFRGRIDLRRPRDPAVGVSTVSIRDACADDDQNSIGGLGEDGGSENEPIRRRPARR